jgi:hypothetical protein
MTANRYALLVPLLVVSCAPAGAEVASAPGSLVSVTIVVEGHSAPLYPSPDGSGRYYVEARAGAAYEVRLDNRSGERVGVLLSVDGLNAISGELDRSRLRPGDPGRMYVLEPWEGSSVRGWRTSLSEVNRFIFVDERASYAARSGKDTSRLGWIDVAVYRERRPEVWRYRGGPSVTPRTEERDGARAQPLPPAAAADADGLTAKKNEATGGAYPGTGWGDRAWDQAMVVDFRPCPEPAERVTLRYEYAWALARLGVFPRPWPPRDRLAERENGFALPPPR